MQSYNMKHQGKKYEAITEHEESLKSSTTADVGVIT